MIDPGLPVGIPDVEDKQPLTVNAVHDLFVPAFVKPLISMVCFCSDDEHDSTAKSSILEISTFWLNRGTSDLGSSTGRKNFICQILKAFSKNKLIKTIEYYVNQL